jgi:hypothetical protein
MGYVVKIEKSTAVIPNVNRTMILDTWKNLNAPENDHMKRGQSFSRSGGVESVTKHYSWLPTHYDTTVKSIEDMLDLFEFSYEVDPITNDIAITGYEAKMGQEELFFQRVFDLLTGKIFWHGEDDSRWVWNFGKLPKNGSFNTEI